MSIEPSEVAAGAARLMTETLPGASVTIVRIHEAEAVGDAAMNATENRMFVRAADTLNVQREPNGDGELLALPLVAEPSAADPLPRRLCTGVALVDAVSMVDEQTLERLQFVADRAAVSLAHAALYQTQVAVAQRIQRLLLPPGPPGIDGLDVGVFFRSRTLGAEIGGDFYDFTSSSPGQLMVAIGDVSGKGIEAGSVMIMTKYALRAVVRTSRWPAWPGDVLRDLHNALQGQIEAPRFVTVALALIDAKRRSMVVASAGHPSPLIMRRGRVEAPLLATAPALALTEAAEIDAYPTERFEFESGETVIFFTDGVSELRDAAGRFYGDVRIEQALNELRGLPAQQIADRLAADAASFSARPPADDIAIVALRFA